ncbi:unnamed protein product [Closterium sp. NIES-64]|nr:unnamed protein product [Closterium sp. Naga37s-1]CAI5962336.1 unnamed protein product [Closterium sp. NIES-64]CAI5989372.1 unnamed protein product [Closterium sp. NIES-65]CAI5521715.1 unnamed protein product [Closterium sp. Naga37s-1]CAI5996798.1 unnamed protein product [Closterium sp. NIES-64]
MAAIAQSAISGAICAPAVASVEVSGRTSIVSFNGLKATSLRQSVKASLSQRVSSKRSSRVVCEATGTEVAGPVTDATFKNLVLESNVPVLIDFWAPWCGPCRMIAPLIDELAKEYNGKLKCYKLNTDESPNVATEYGIRSIPTVMIFKKGKKVDTVIGAVPKSTLTATIDKYL